VRSPRFVLLLFLSALAFRPALGDTPPLSLTNIYPPSTLLPPGSTTLNLSFTTPIADTCGYSVNTLLDFSEMPLIDTAGPVTNHQGTVTGINPNPQVVNGVYIRCAAEAGFWALDYRVVTAPTGNFPRIGSIWGGEYILSTVPAQAAKIQLYLSPGMSTDDITSLRATNPGVLILFGGDATYTTPGGPFFPDDYYMKDMHGNKIQIWDNATYLLNLTKPEVAEAVANFVYQQLLQSNLAFDGTFFDNVFTSISWQTTDVFGNPIQMDPNNDGVPEDPATLDAQWRAGMLHELDTYHALVPWGYLSAHPGEPLDAGLLPRFNGDSSVFQPVNVREGRMAFTDYWNNYQNWFSRGLSPGIAQVQSAPPSIISYGYGFSPLQTLPASTVTFAEEFYPNMRFGLATSVMNDGFSTYDQGDTGCCVDWWYDEYDFNLGQAVSPAARVTSGTGPNLVTNGGFENGLNGWSYYIDNDGQAAATVNIDNATVAEGSASVNIDVTSADSNSWQVNLYQTSLPLTAGTNYQLQFWARADAVRFITIDCESASSPYNNYGLLSQISIDTTWTLYTLTFVANTTAQDGTLQFDVGDVAGNVWIDGVQLFEQAPDVYRRDFTNGIALLNGTGVSQIVAIEPGFQRFTGAQAPLYQYIVDDGDPGFSDTGANWYVAYDSTGYAYEVITPPWYNAWNGSLHELDTPPGSAQWNLGIPADGQYTIQAWLPNAPGDNGWTHNAEYQIVAGGNVVASASLDQSSALTGDQWHTLFTNISLTAASAPVLTLTNAASGSLIADAIYITSSARYNDGSPATQVTLAPFDGILLQRQQPVAAPASRVERVYDAAGYQPAITSGGWFTIFGNGFASAAQTWQAGPADTTLPTSLDGVSVTVNGKPAYLGYVSSGQINAIAPDDSTLGPVQVAVTTAQAAAYPGTVAKQNLAPQFFAWNVGATSYVAAVHADSSAVGPSSPATTGEQIELYGTGFGPTNPSTPSGQLISAPVPLASLPSITIGGVNATVNQAYLVGPGLYAITVTVPAASAGNQSVQAQMAGFQSSGNVFLNVQSQ